MPPKREAVYVTWLVYNNKKMEKRKLYKCVIDDENRLGVHAIGLVEEPAIEENWVYLNAVKLSAVNNEKRMLYGAALVPDKQILRIDKDTMEEYYIVFDKETIYKCAHLYLKKNLQHAATIEHEFAVTGVTMVESWIVEDSEKDKSTAMGMSLPQGTWMIGMFVEDDAIWSGVKEEKIKGFSIEGLFNNVAVSLSKNFEEDAFFRDLDLLLQDIKKGS